MIIEHQKPLIESDQLFKNQKKQAPLTCGPAFLVKNLLADHKSSFADHKLMLADHKSSFADHKLQIA
ncbi:hypothetical protein [Planomicrobium okeanokoites]|uniref:hypothetical protein n=1 Tax=Planomicrobium okeanokoites TaxID=244 RepID=UPI0036166827